MSIYAIGDVQGCYEPLMRLLDHIGFDASQDSLWFCGDLINRGPESLAVLRWVYAHKNHVKTVLGNHDLHTLAIASGAAPVKKSDTISELLNAPDASELLHYLHSCPLYVHENNWLMTHAGLPPHWSVTQLIEEAEFTAALWRDHGPAFFTEMYGNEPALWSPHLTELERARYCINALTRMRYVNAQGALNLTVKSAPGEQTSDLMPWFAHPALALGHTKLVFGHWASLMGNCPHPQIFALDTGCVWGAKLSALKLENCARFSVSA